MPAYKIIRLSHLSQLHVSAGRDSYDVAAGLPSSDGLSAALAALRARGGRADDLEKWLGSFAMSAAFPFVTINDTPQYFLPKPQGRIDVAVRGQEEKQYRKALKSMQYIAPHVWSRLIAGEHVDVEESQLRGVFLLDEPVERFASPMVRQTNARVAVSRDGGDAVPFAFEWTYFRDDAGLYCIVECDNERYSELVALMTELGEQGFGSDRSVGGGHFEVTAGELTLTVPSAPDAYVLLSSYIPKDGTIPDEVLERSRYQVLTRGGFVAGGGEGNIHYRRNAVRMVACGSVLASAKEPVGKVVNLKPGVVNHAVWRSGVPVAIPVKLNQSQS